MSGEEGFIIQQGAFSWKNLTSQNTTVSDLVISLGSTAIATYPFLDSYLLTQSFNSAIVSGNSVGLLHVDATLYDDITRYGANPGDKVAVALHSITARRQQNLETVTKTFASPLLSNTLVVVPFSVLPSASSPSGIQVPQSNALIGVWDFRSLLMADFGSVNVRSIRISLSGNGDGPLKNVTLARYGEPTNLASLSSATVPSTSVTLDFSGEVPFAKGSLEKLVLRADTTQFKQGYGGVATLALSLTGYTIADRNDTGKNIFIDLSEQPVQLSTLIF